MLCFVYRGLICRWRGGRVPARRVRGGGSGDSIDIQNVWRSGGGGASPLTAHTHTRIILIHTSWLNTGYPGDSEPAWAVRNSRKATW
jgi:hypothetical protein